MIPASLTPFANHLWQSTIFAGLMMLLTMALRNNRAQIRYGLWLAASLKFLVPFSLLVAAGGQFGWRTTPALVTPQLARAVEQVSQPFAPSLFSSTATSPVSTAFVPGVILGIWFCGFAVVILSWGMRWLRIRTALRAASSLPLEAPIKVLSSPTLLEPGVFGIFRPVLMLPEGIADRLTPSQFQAILAHELCHVRRRDNLAAAVHMSVEALFWFHPLAWWIGAKLIEERERACDEEVLRMGSEPLVYAEGILTVCKFYLESPLACASGVTGADLKKRMEAIMSNRILHSLTFTRKLLLSAAGIAALMIPVAVGLVTAPRGHAQPANAAQSVAFEVASIKPGDPAFHAVSIDMTPVGRLTATNASLKQLIAIAYDVRESQISGGPDWLDSARYNIIAKSDSAELAAEPRDRRGAEVKKRLRTLLSDRFQLVTHTESRELPMLALVVGKGGPKLKESAAEGDRVVRSMRIGRGQINAVGVAMAQLANSLSNVLGRTVVDRTGLKGNFDIQMEWTPDPNAPWKPGAVAQQSDLASVPDLTGPSIFTAIQEQLGLKLEARKGPVEVIVIDRAEKASAN